MRIGRLRWFLMSLACIVFFTGYTAGGRGLQKSLEYKLEMLFPGAAQDYSNYSSSENPDFKSVPLLHVETYTLFQSGQKGPRADLLSQELAANGWNQQQPKRVMAALSSLQSDTVSDADHQTMNISSDILQDLRSSTQVVTRERKSDRLPVHATYIQKTALIDHRDVIANLFSAPLHTGSVSQFSLPQHDGGMGRLRLASFGQSEVLPNDSHHLAAGHNEISKQKRKAGEVDDEAMPSQHNSDKKNKLYYGELMSAAKRKQEHLCLAKAIYFEARGEPVHGQLAVAQVVMNRVREEYYPNTICGVVFEGSQRRTGCQFSFACDRIPDVPRDRPLWQLAKSLADKTMNGEVWLKDIGYASHYHATYVNPKWKKYMKRITRVGVHIFYRGTFLPKIYASKDPRVSSI